MEACLHCKERWSEALPKSRGPLGRVASTLPIHREAIVFGKDLCHQVSRRLHQLVDPLGEKGEVRALNILNPKTTLTERPACGLLIRKSYLPGIPLLGSSPKESTYTRNEPISNGTRDPQDGEEEGGDSRENCLDQDQMAAPR